MRGLRMLVGALGVAACMGGPVQAEKISFGDTGSMFGGATWTITPDDHVRYDAYQVEGGLSLREGWVWDNAAVKAGHITFAMPGAFATASAIVTEGLRGLGPAPAYQRSCTDAGSLVMVVEIAGFDFEAQGDNCIFRDDSAPAPVRAHYDGLRAVAGEIVNVLGLDRLE